MDDLTEEELLQIVSGGVQNIGGYIYQPQFTGGEYGGSEQGGGTQGTLESILRYAEGKTEPGQTYEKIDPTTGKVAGTGKFQKVGNAWDLAKQAASDLGPILQFTPLAPFVRAIGALSAAEQGNVLGAIASGLPLADKIPGLDKATVTALQNAGKYASVASAAKSKDPMQLLNALSQTPEFGGKIPQELKTIGDYASKAGALQRASKGDIGALIGLAKGEAKSGGKGYLPGYESSEEISEGFFAPGGEGYDASQDENDYIQSLINSEAALPPDVEEFLPAQEVIRERISLEDRYPAPEGTVTDTSSSEPADKTFDITANLPGLNEDFTLEDLLPGTGSSTQRTVNVSEDKPAQIEITGRREVPDYTQDLFPPIDPRSIRDIGYVTKIAPGEKLEGTDIKEPDLSVGLPTANVGKKTEAKTGMSTQDLMRLLLAMQGQSPEQEEDYRLFAGQPLGYELMYGLRG